MIKLTVLRPFRINGRSIDVGEVFECEDRELLQDLFSAGRVEPTPGEEAKLRSSKAVTWSEVPPHLRDDADKVHVNY